MAYLSKRSWLFFGGILSTIYLNNPKTLLCRILIVNASSFDSFYVKGRTLDVFAREPLWKIGLDYRHGTGHGIGHFLNVHEGTNTHLRAGMKGHMTDDRLIVLDLTR